MQIDKLRGKELDQLFQAVLIFKRSGRMLSIF